MYTRAASRRTCGTYHQSTIIRLLLHLSVAILMASRCTRSPLCIILENGKLLHMALCGPAHDLCAYQVMAGSNAAQCNGRFTLRTLLMKRDRSSGGRGRLAVVRTSLSSRLCVDVLRWRERLRRGGLGPLQMQVTVLHLKLCGFMILRQAPNGKRTVVLLLRLSERCS